MRVCACFLLFGIFASHSAPEIGAKNSTNKRSAEAKKLYNGHNNNTADTDGNKTLELVFRAPRVDSFTDFIEETVDILNIYEDGAFKEFFLILEKEIKNYHYKGCKVSELMDNTNTKSFLTQALKTIRGKPVAYIKAYMNAAADMLREETYDISVKELIDYINSFYKNFKKEFHRVLSTFYHYRNTNSMNRNNFVQVIRDGIRTILFNHYSELDKHTRRELNEKIESFWEKIKNSQDSEAELNDIVSKNEMNEHRLNHKKDSLTNLQDKDIREDVKSIESEEQVTDYTAELSSQQSFDSSSNSIKLSQERREDFNTERYVTLYTEEMSYKARTTKETGTPGRHKSQSRPAPTPRYNLKNVLSDKTNKVEILRMNRNKDDIKQDSSPDLRHNTESSLIPESKHELRAKPHSVQPRGQSKPAQTRSKSRHKNAQMISQYDAVIDVQLANTKLLEALRMFAPAGAGSREADKYDKSVHQRSAARRRAQIEINPQSPATSTKSPSQYSTDYKKPVNELRSISPPSVNIEAIEKHVEYVNHSGNDTKVSHDYINKRISALENELKDLKQIRDVRSKASKNNTDVIKPSNITNQVKDMTEYNIEKLTNIHHDLEIKDVTKEKNNENNTKSYSTNAETTINYNTYFKPNAISNVATNATGIEKTTISQITNSAVDASTVTVTAAHSPVDITTVMTAVSDVTARPRQAMAYSTPAYYDYPDRRLDPFEHMNDDLDLNM